MARARALAPGMGAEGQGWFIPGKSLWEDNEDGASLFTAVHTGRRKRQVVTWEVQTGYRNKKLFSYFPITV